MRGYGAAYAVLSGVRDAVSAELVAHGGTLPARVAIYPGTIAWDDCNQCGLLAVSSVRYFLSDKFPLEVAVTDYGPGSVFCADMAVQVVRCAPQPADGELSPPPAALERSAQQVNDDGYSIICATRAYLQALKDRLDIDDYMIRNLTFPGPEGACVGAELGFVVGFDQ